MKSENPCEQAAVEEMAAGRLHGQIHPQAEEHLHEHYHGQICPHAHGAGDNEPSESSHAHPLAGHARARSERADEAGVATITLRCHTGVSGDMLLAGLMSLIMADRKIAPDSPEADQWLGKLTGCIMPELADAAVIRKHEVNGISGWQAQVNLPRAHEHRSMEDIRKILTAAKMHASAKKRAGICFDLLAMCEGAAHNVDPAEVHFHEVGALDSILDVCGVCELYARLREPRLVCGSLPIADGEIHCAHGCLPAPAPAVLKLLEGVPVRPFGGDANAGELVTPTGMALLRAMDAFFGPWPEFLVDYTSLVYGQRVFANTANGMVLALGHALIND